jgi:signal transduction histidine kinase
VWGTSYVGDLVLAAAVTIAAVVTAVMGLLYVPQFPHTIVLPGLTYTIGQPYKPNLVGVPSWALVGVVATTVPLALRRTYPTAAFSVILVAYLATRGYLTAITVGAVIFAAYCAVAYSKYRRTTLLCLAAAAIIVTVVYPDAAAQVPERFVPVLVLLPTAAVGNMTRMWRERAGESAQRLRLAQAEHEADKRRVLELERARIARELHDVVTHNVSVMIIQAGAARRALEDSSGKPSLARRAPLAREAMLAVEVGGRNAMTELRHLLGLLAPAQGTATAGPAGTAEPTDAGLGELSPQPGLDQLPALIDRIRTAGLEAELSVTGTRRALPPGLDLAAYRVVQEALTNVMKHAGRAHTAIHIEYRPRELRITVSDDGRPADTRLVTGQLPGRSGHGLIGLRERIAIYHGELDAGPRPGGGWRVSARIPLEPAADGQEQVRPGFQAASS